MRNQIEEWEGNLNDLCTMSEEDACFRFNVDSKYEALKDAEALILITEWKEFRQPDMEEIKNLLKNPVIFDGRNQYDKKMMRKLEIEYYQIGVGSK